MAGRGSPLSHGSFGFTLKSIRNNNFDQIGEENPQADTGYSGAPKKNILGPKTQSEKSKAKSKVPSDRHSNFSHDSRIRSAEVDMEMDDELRKLEKEEDEFRLQIKNLDSEMECIKDEISYYQKQIEDDSSLTKTEMKQWKQKVTDNEQILLSLRKKKILLMNEEPGLMKDLRSKIAKIQAKTNLKKLKITVENEQYLGSDEEADGVVIPVDVQDGDRIEEFINSAVETQKQNEAAAEEIRLVAAKKAEEKAKQEAKEKAKREAEEIQKELEDIKRQLKLRQEETERLTAEKNKRTLDLEAKLLQVKVEDAPTVEDKTLSIPTLTGEGKLVQILAEAIRGSLPTSSAMPDNSKFFARQSYSKDLPNFSGKAEEWPIFFADFERSTKDCGFSNSENMSRLRKCLKGDAARYVQSLMVSPDNVPTVMKKLEIRYGQPELIIDAMISKARAIPTFKDEQLELFIDFGSAVQNVIATIETLDRPGHLSNPQLLKEFEAKLPRNYMMQWLNWVDGDSTRERNLINFGKWIDRQTTLACKACPPDITEDNSSKSTIKVKSESQRPVKKKADSFEKYLKTEECPTAAGLFVGEKYDKSRCIFCEKHPDSSSCVKAQDMTLSEKTQIVKDKNACEYCLKVGHWKRACKAFIRCPVCRQRHCTLMCKELHKDEEKMNEPTTTEENKSAVDQVQTINDNLACTSKVLLKTLIVTIISKNGNRKVRAILDDGSQRSYITKKLALDLDLNRIGSEELAHALFSGVLTDVRKHNRYSVQLKNSKGPGSSSVEVLDQEKICGTIPRHSSGPWMRELKEKNIWISDIGDGSPEVELLIGADFLGKLLTGKVCQLKNGLTAVETILGWSLMGRTKCHREKESLAMTTTSMFVCDASVSQLWDLEVIGIRDPIEKENKFEHEEKARQHFLDTVSRKEDGRYVVSLPWINGKMKVPDNRKIAEKRLESTTKKLLALEKFNEYDKIFMDWCQEGIIEEVAAGEFNQDCHYIPHRAVFKPDSLTTPIRPVFDASCKAPRTPSLNQCLEKGPNLLELIPSILLKFREKKIGLVADIRKAFQMIELKEDDRDYVRFLWWADLNRSVHKIYRHRRVVFGVNCSPFLLAAVLEHLLTNVKEEDFPMAEKVLKSLYVDNLVTSVDTLEEAFNLKTWSTEILASAKMELREWEGGFVEKSGIGPVPGCGLDFGKTVSQGFGKETTSVLGYKWNKLEDNLCVDLELEKLPVNFSKRTVLSFVQKIYDPVGFTCPVTLQPKLLLQKLWESKTGWDDELDEDQKNEFLQWCNQLHLLRQVSVPRNISGGNSNRCDWQIHTFCDASQDAYAAVVYLRVENEEAVSVQLLMAKARVAPLKKPTINRLELLSCYIAAILTDSVKESLDLEDVPVTYWSDSSTALAWIRGNDEWGTFVGNRVRTICQLSDPQDWRHVPGVKNPADLPSRGCSPSQLLASNWWEGPEWLKSPREEWPCEETPINEDEVVAEKRKSSSSALLNIHSDEKEIPWYCSKSTFQKNIIAVAWLRRFIKYLSKDRSQLIVRSGLTSEEMESAEKCLLLLIQKETLPIKENVIAGIQVCRKEDELLRVKTKLDNREDAFGFRYPVLLPFNHILVDQLILELHIKYKHAGAQFLIGKLRENYWIIWSRRAVKRVINKCIACRRFDCKKSNVVPAPLPEERVATAKVFENIGIDFAGPLFTKVGRKAWILLITCAVYRCVHLELVVSLSTDSFMDAFSRFTARRGRPSVVFSDNGTNFVGAENALKELDWEKIQAEYAMEKIEWKFNPPASPWWGGFFERIVRSVKALLRRTLGKSKLSFEKLETCIVEVEAVINGRPLTVVTEDPTDLIPLTPAMFLHEMTYPGATDRELLEESGFQKLLVNRKTFLDEIKMRFRKEYLSLLIQRGKEKPVREFHVGDVVLLGSDDNKRWEWPLARILELIAGKDGHVRVAKVKTVNGTFTRPIQWLFPMEISSPTEIPEMKTRSGRKVKVPNKFGQ